MSTPLPVHRSRLGRGLASLIGDNSSSPGVGVHQSRLPPEGEQKVVAIDMISSSALNPRKDFDQAELAELAESIRQKGLVQPIIVRPAPSWLQANPIARTGVVARGPVNGVASPAVGQTPVPATVLIIPLAKSIRRMLQGVTCAT